VYLRRGFFFQRNCEFISSIFTGRLRYKVKSENETGIGTRKGNSIKFTIPKLKTTFVVAMAAPVDVGTILLAPARPF
jgi:hypothetical protein